jgi:hypothetical protein
MRTGLKCLKIRSSDVLWLRHWNSGFHKCWKFPDYWAVINFSRRALFNGNHVMKDTERIPILAGNLNHALILSPFTHPTRSSFDSSHCRSFRRHFALFICYNDSIILAWCRRTRFQGHSLELTPSAVDPRHRSQRASVLSTVTIGRKGASRSMTGGEKFAWGASSRLRAWYIDCQMGPNEATQQGITNAGLLLTLRPQINVTCCRI